MSFEAEDETELRDLVTATLQTSGVLGKIKVCVLATVKCVKDNLAVIRHNLYFQAQLRSNVYLAIEGDSELKVSKKLHFKNSLTNMI